MKKINLSKVVTVEYQPDLGIVSGKRAYLMSWEDINVGKGCNERGIRGQIFRDNGEAIKSMEKRGFEIKMI